MPAKALIDDHGVRRVPCRKVTYHHLLFDKHQIIESHGLWSESYYPVAHQEAGWAQDTQTELLEIFPQLELGDLGPLARTAIPVKLAGLLRQG